MATILGAGLSGIATADHLSINSIPYEIFEGKSHGGGHIYSEKIGGFTWDEGPHVSFTKSDYVKNYFAQNCNQAFLEFAASPSNYFKGNWIPHPAQSNMYAIPEPLRSQCISDLKLVRSQSAGAVNPENYQDWLEYAFGKTFSNHFPEVYTEKYWTTQPNKLTTDWIGNRIYFPEIADMIDSANGPLQKSTHYLTKFRYPETGGFYSYIKEVEKKIPIQYNKKLERISFKNKQLFFSDGTNSKYERLVNTLPLPALIQMSDAPDDIKDSALKLKCSEVLIVNVVVSHAAPIENQWIYVYDKDLYASRINFTELLSPNNGESGKSGIQVEVYFSKYRPMNDSIKNIEKKVLEELVQMGLALSPESIESYNSKWIEFANVIFDFERVEAQEKILNWLSTYGLKRETDDLSPMTDWVEKNDKKVKLGDIILAGRFAQWKYYWTDDCVLRGKYISENY